MNKLKIGGVPEYFNAPWHYGIAQNAFTKAQLEIEFIDYPTGTGAMCQDLADDKLDLAIVLTEGALYHIANEPKLALVAPFVTTPLYWGVHVAHDSPINSIDDCRGHTFAISRYGSGSHLMAFLLAEQRQWHDQDAIDFALAGNLTQLCAAAVDKGQIFLWEKLTTQHLVDQGRLKCIGTVPTPWPCFYLIGKSDWQNSPAIQKMLQVLLQVMQQFNEKSAEIINFTAKYYRLDPQDIAENLAAVKWASHIEIDPQVVASVQQSLFAAGLIKNPHF